ncbi:MAG: hypothetical protein GY811_29940 [Myxococcales bacterium]|nr:hypothetical protein [Myxococcales bacterium]
MLQRHQENLELIKRVLDKNYVELHLATLSVEENADETKTTVALGLSDGEQTLQLRGSGVGLVDAVFHALVERYGAEYPSLRSIELADFQVVAKLDTKNGKTGVDSVGTVRLEVHNSEGRSFEFSDESRSVSRSAARTVVAAVEYFVNAERAFITLHQARLDAKERKRVDLVTRYTRELAEVVESTSFTEVIERMKEDL